MPELVISQDRESLKSPPTYYATEEEKKRVADIKSKYADRNIIKRGYERTWFLTGSFIRGLHYVSWNDYTQTFEIPRRIPVHRVRLVINYPLAYHRRTKSRLTAHKPGIYVAPATPDKEDQDKAKASTKLLESLLDQLDWQVKYKDFVGWTLEAGTCIKKVTWNPRKGPVLTNPETGEPEIGNDGRPVHLGEHQLDVVSPYELDVDQAATTIEDARWLMHTKARSIEWVREQYPNKGRFVTPENVSTESFYEKRLKQTVGIYGYTTGTHGDENKTAKGLVNVHEYWEAPSGRYPKGRLIIVAKDVVLHDGPNPYNHGKFPFVEAREVDVSGRFWGMAMLEQVIPLIRNLNKARSQEVENRNLMGRPKMLVPRTSKVGQHAFDAEAGEIIDYHPGPRGEKPELLAPATTTLSTQNEIQHTLNDIQEVLAWHEASRGILPSANVPAAALERLQRADDSSLGVTNSNLEDMARKVAVMLLWNSAQFYSEERLVRVVGHSNEVEATRIKGDQISGDDPQANYFDVRVRPGSMMAKDPKEVREEIAAMLEFRLLNPEMNGAHRQMIIKAMGTGFEEELYREDADDTQWAEQENELIAKGEESVPMDFENHQIHILRHNQFRKNARFRQLDPQAQEAFAKHVEEHEIMLVITETKKNMMAQEILQAAGASAAEEETKAAGGEQGGGEEGLPSPKGEGTISTEGA